MLNTLRIPGEEELLSAKPGQTAVLTGMNLTLASVLACRAARTGRRTLLVAENDLKASRAADDARQLAGEAAFLPGGEIDLTRAAGSLESSWRRLEALSAVCTENVRILCAGAEAMAQHGGALKIVFLVMILGFGVKAGMFPAHSWLPTAHPVAPAPASAVLSGVITKMGVLGIIRTVFYIAGAQNLKGTYVQYTFMTLSLITVVMGSTLAFKEKLFKKRLAYSTVSQVSYVLFGLSTMTQAGFVGACLHIVFHSLIKNTLFMSAGAVIHKTGLTQVEELKGIGKRMPVTMTLFTVVSLGLIGIPPTGGFVSKWNLAQGALSAGVKGAWIGPACLLLSAILTAAYLLGISIKAFFTGEDDRELVKCEPTWRMLAPMAVFAVLSVALGVLPGGLIAFFSRIATALLQE